MKRTEILKENLDIIFVMGFEVETYLLSYLKHMKNKFLSFAMVCFLSLSMTSCYTVSYAVGAGSQTGVTVVEKNHFLVAGLAPIKIADPTKMAGDAKDYQVTIKHSFVDGLFNILTSGMYTPTTTIVKK